MRASPISAERERELVAAADRGDEGATRQLVERFLPAIGSVARRFDAGGPVQRAELLQEGVAGLLFAVKRYDPSTETPFWAYASFWVRKAMQELIAEVARPVALSDHAVRGLAQIRTARREHLQACGGEPTSAQLAVSTGLPRPQVESLLAIERAPRSFDEPLGGDEGTPATLGDTVADPHAEDAYSGVLDAMELDAVRRLADSLSARERAILTAHYGLGRAAQTLNDIGSDLGLTAERIRQIEEAALAKLRHGVAQRHDAAVSGTLNVRSRRLLQTRSQ